jgi:hypothetical protein
MKNILAGLKKAITDPKGFFNEKLHKDYFSRIIVKAFSDLEVVTIIKPNELGPLEIDGKKYKRNIHECLNQNKKLQNGDVESAGLFYCPFTVSEYKDDIHILFNIKKRGIIGKNNIPKIFEPDINDNCYFIFDIKPNNNDQRKIIFLSDNREYADSSLGNLFNEISKRAVAFTVMPEAQLILKITMMAAVNYYINNLSETCFEDEEGKIRAENIFPELLERKLSSSTEIIEINTSKDKYSKSNLYEEEDRLTDKTKTQNEKVNKNDDSYPGDISENEIIDQSFENLGTEYVLYNFKDIIKINGIPNQRIDGKDAIEDLASINKDGQGAFDIICTQACHPQRLFYFSVTDSYILDEDTIFYYLSYQPTEIKEIHNKFALEVNARDNKKREIYIFEKLPKINSNDYSHINLDDMFGNMRFSFLFFEKANSKNELKVFLKKCAQKTLGVYKEKKMAIQMGSYSNIDDENSDSKNINKNNQKKVEVRDSESKNSKNLKCTNCKNQVDMDDKFCSSCGEKIKLKKNCNHCNKSLRLSDKYCRNCGTKVNN